MIVLEDNLYLSDNIDDDGLTPPNGTEIVHILRQLPLRRLRSVVMFCRKGEVRIRANVTDYCLRARNLLIMAANAHIESCTIAEGTQWGIMAISSDLIITPVNDLAAIKLQKAMLGNPAFVELSAEYMEHFGQMYGLLKSLVADGTF